MKQSSRTERTRTAIIEAAGRLWLEHGPYGAGLEDVAREAGVTRRTVYLHFANKSALLLAYVHHSEAGAGLPGLVESMLSATTPDEIFEALARAQVEYVPRVFPSMRLVHAARGSDAAADEVWMDRMQARRRVFRILVTRISDWGALDPALNIDDATDLLWVLTTPHMYEYLVVDGGWALERYRRHIVRLLNRALLGPK